MENKDCRKCRILTESSNEEEKSKIGIMKENKTSWLGVLATEEEVKQNGLKESNCVVNGAGNLQFYLRVISEIPNQEPENKYVVCFQNKFTGEGIVDNSKLERKQRAEFYKKQLETCLF